MEDMKLNDTMAALGTIDGVTVELCGSWLWIDGDTYEAKDSLKRLGCMWSRSKRRWYWRNPETSKGWSHGKTTMSHIRTRYGSRMVKEKD